MSDQLALTKPDDDLDGYYVRYLHQWNLNILVYRAILVDADGVDPDIVGFIFEMEVSQELLNIWGEQKMT